MKNDLILFEDYKIRRLYDEVTETWYFSVIDIIQILTQQPDFQRARNYWNVLKSRLNKEGNESLTFCKRLKLEAADPERSLNRARETWQKHGRSEKWIQQRMMGQETRNKLTDYWKDHDVTLHPLNRIHSR